MTEAHMTGSFCGIFVYHLKKTILWIVFEIVTYVLLKIGLSFTLKELA